MTTAYHQCSVNGAAVSVGGEILPRSNTGDQVLCLHLIPLSLGARGTFTQAHGHVQAHPPFKKSPLLSSHICEICKKNQTFFAGQQLLQHFTLKRTFRSPQMSSEQMILLADCFFLRNDPSRFNDIHLVATIAYQIFLMVEKPFLGLSNVTHFSSPSRS